MKVVDRAGVLKLVTSIEVSNEVSELEMSSNSLPEVENAFEINDPDLLSELELDPDLRVNCDALFRSGFAAFWA